LEAPEAESTAGKEGVPMTRSPNDARAPGYGSEDRAGSANAASEAAASRPDRVEPRAAERAAQPPAAPPAPAVPPPLPEKAPRATTPQGAPIPPRSSGTVQRARPAAPPLAIPPPVSTAAAAPAPAAAPAAPPIPAPAAAAPASPAAAAPPASAAAPPAPPAAAAAAAAAPPAPPIAAPRAVPAAPPAVTAPVLDGIERQGGVPPSSANGHDRQRGASVPIADKSERLLGVEEIDVRLAALEQTPGVLLGGSALPTDLAEVRALFTQLAANHVRPVRDFMLDLRSGDASAEWLPICEPALRSLRRAGAKLGLVEMCASLDRFSDALSRAQKTGAPLVTGDERRGLLALYEELGRTMPQAFALESDRNGRESVILQSLLLQVVGVKKVTLDRLVAAGLWSLEAMFLASAPDIASTTGIDPQLAQQIVDRFQAYRAHVRSIVPDATRARERQRIADLTSRLRREHADYERASQSWSREASDAKKELRSARARTMFDIQVELARLGEVECLAQIERLPFEKKIAELKLFLDEARDKYGAQPGC
jgi:hypothetical protein